VGDIAVLLREGSTGVCVKPGLAVLTSKAALHSTTDTRQASRVNF
jgi:hypothetical protein